MSTLLAGLGGALVGALAAIGAQWLANHHARKADRRRELIDLVARFWGTADRLWSASVTLEQTIVEYMASREAGHGVRLDELDEQRLARIAEKKAADSEARFLVAQMRLLHPVLAAPAEEVREASSTYKHEERRKQQAIRGAAVEAYEDAARRLLGDHG